VWCRAHLGAPSLPSRLGQLQLFTLPLPPSVRAIVRIRALEGMTVRSDVDLVDADGLLHARLEDFVCTASPSLQRAFAADPGKPSVLPTA